MSAVEVWTGDLQAVVSFVETSLPDRAGRESVSVSITPRHPASIGDLPAGWFPDGNAYEIVVDDAGVPVRVVSPPGQLHLAVPHETTSVLFAEPGSGWQRVDADADAVGGQAVVELARTGTYLAVTDHRIGADGEAAPIAPAAAAIGGSLLLLAGLLALRRRVERARARAAGVEQE